MSVDVAIRSAGIGGSDIAAIVGLDPRRDAFAVYADKLGLVERAAPSPRMIWGKRIEKVIAEAYGQETSQHVVWYDTTLANPIRPWQVYTPDAFVTPAPTSLINIGGVDAKNVAFDQAWMWGDGKDAAPDHIALQCQWYMSAADLPWWDVAALFGGHDLRIVRVHRDPEVEGIILEAAANFWREHVLAQNPPPIGATNTAAEYLKQRFPKHVEALRSATDSETELLAQLKQARLIFADAERDKVAVENEVKQAIGDGEGLTLGKDKVTWKRAKDTMGTDWEEIAHEIARTHGVHAEELEHMRLGHQVVTREGSRKLIVPRAWGKGEE